MAAQRMSALLQIEGTLPHYQILLTREQVSRTAWFGVGLLLGLAIILRFHLIPGVLPLLAFAVLPPVRQHRPRAVPMLLLGLALVFEDAAFPGNAFQFLQCFVIGDLCAAGFG